MDAFHYQRVPKDPMENLAFRSWVLREGDSSTAFRLRLREACIQDPLFYLNTFIWTYDPRLKDGQKFLPFNTWGVQDAAFHAILNAIQDGRDLVIEKSRDMGASWLCLLAFEYLWHWRQGTSFMMVSRKLELVDDKANPRSLFGKIALIHARTPNWLMPEGWNPKKHAIAGVFKNPEMMSSIRAETTTGAAGVGDRDTAILADEFSRWEPKEARLFAAGTVDTSNCRIFNFTPFGTTNTAYLMAMKDNFRKLKLHWSADPRKNWGMYQYDGKAAKVRFYHWVPDAGFGTVQERGPWEYPKYDSEGNEDPSGKPFDFVLDGVLRSPVYDAYERRHSNRREMAMMWDIDYEGSSFPFFDKIILQDHAAQFGREPLWEGDIEADPETGNPLALVKVAGGPLKLWIMPDERGQLAKSQFGFGAGVDTSLGRGATNSCASFGDCRTGRKVAAYVSPFIAPEAFAVKVVALCKMLKSRDDQPTELAWESGGPGDTFGDKVIALGYRRVYLRSNEKPGVGLKKVTDTAGWIPNNATRFQLLSAYRLALQTKMCVNPDRTALAECEMFQTVPDGVEYSAAEGSFDAVTGAEDPTGAKVNHGDRVIADGLMWKMILSRGKLTREKTQEVQGTTGLAWRRALVVQRERQAAESSYGDD